MAPIVRLVPTTAVEARISGRCAVSRRREPPKVRRQVLGSRLAFHLGSVPDMEIPDDGTFYNTQVEDGFGNVKCD